MWSVTVNNSDSIYFLKNESTLTFGRIGTDVIIEEDTSISRRHATISLEGGKLMLEDNKSKYGTFVNDNWTESFQQDKMINSGAKVELKSGDKVRLGRFNSKYEVKCYKTSTSMLSAVESRKLGNILKKLGIDIDEEVTENSSHLTTSNDTCITQKLTVALAMMKPVVTIDYWEKVLSCVNDKVKLPNESEFQPNINERSLTFPNRISLAVNPDRSNLFEGKTFVFASKRQQKENQNVISACGGVSMNLVEQKNMEIKNLLNPGILFIQPSSRAPSAKDAKLSKILLVLKTKNLRAIPENEIGNAILYVSTDRWCNAKQDSVLSGLEPSHPPNYSATLAHSSSSMQYTDSQRKSPNLDFTEHSDEEENLIEMKGSEYPETEHMEAETLDEIQSRSNKLEIDENENVEIPKIDDKENQEMNLDSVAESVVDDIDSFFAKPTTRRNKRKSVDISASEESQASNSRIKKLKTKEPETSIFSVPTSQLKKTSSLKRLAKIDTADGLFDFGPTQKKRTRHEDDVVVEKPPPRASTSHLLSKVDTRSFYLDEFNDSGPWLSRKMSAIKLDDLSGGGIKQEIDSDVENDGPFGSTSLQQEKPDLKSTISLFDIVDGSICPTPSTLSRGKSFVKKNNFKKQRQVITMTLVDI